MDFETGTSGQSAAQLIASAFGAKERYVEFGLQKQYKFWSNAFPGLGKTTLLSILQTLPQVTTDLVGLELVGIIDMAGLEAFLQTSGFSLQPDAQGMFYYTNGVLSVTVVDAADPQGSVTGEQDLQVFHEPFISSCISLTETQAMCELLSLLVPYFA